MDTFPISLDFKNMLLIQIFILLIFHSLDLRKKRESLNSGKKKELLVNIDFDNIKDQY